MDYPMHIGGEAVSTSNPRPVELPYDGSVVGTIFQATKEEVDAAIAAAAAAGPDHAGDDARRALHHPAQGL